MIITNKLGLPQAFVEMCQRDYQQEANEYRVTSLLKGIRETILERRHHDKIEVDVSDMIWLLFGTATHNVLESYEEADCEMKEERLRIPIGGYILSGKFDLYNEEQKKITDYKTASVWKIIYGDFQDWRQQLLIYSYMIASYGFQVAQAEAIALLKDHSKRDAKNKKGYPPLPVAKIPFSFNAKDFTYIRGWLEEKFKEIARAELLPDDELPLCTPEERFNSGDKFAVMKGKNKRAVRVFDTWEEAEKYLSESEKGTHIDTRPGEDKKCEDYCNVNQFCNYYQNKKGDTVCPAV